jgi:hypothetical protein
MSSFEIKIKSIDINYMNSAYVANYSVKSYTDLDNVARVSVWFVTKKVLVDIRISGVGNAKKPSTTEYIEFIKGSVDYCSLSSSFLGQAALKYCKPIVERYGNFTISCPMPIAASYINFPLSEIRLPPFIPIVNADFLLKGHIKTKIRGRRLLTISEIVITGSIRRDQSDPTNTTRG